jgi:hypothetical protein
MMMATLTGASALAVPDNSSQDREPAGRCVRIRRGHGSEDAQALEQVQRLAQRIVAFGGVFSLGSVAVASFVAIGRRRTRCSGVQPGRPP